MSRAYRRAGVDLDAAARAVSLIRELAEGATRPEVLEGVGGFAGLFRMGEGRYLAAATDGIGTKLEVARMAGRLSTVGIDLVAMCADDVACTGAEPLFFLDYLATGNLVPEEAAAIVEGIAEGCRRAGCALLGGETAEHPGVMTERQLDLAGFCVGVVDDDGLIGPHRVREGDVLVGLASSGLHANGYSLVRTTLLVQEPRVLDAVPEGFHRQLADELLEPTAIYAPLVVSLARAGLVHAAAHVTGGGLPENVPRALPGGFGAEIDLGGWPVPPIFELVRTAADVSDDDMFATFNMGVGMVLMVPANRADEAIGRAADAGVHAFGIGRVSVGTGLSLR
ncbi:MAG TPA: phosphoribosylformylglycinamidine cyclo-ligase [Actinomycetota bacterium]|nr:phosphoribosylformylglycinamidine cyclo-ligase [Actinomycetota bacterium]